MDATDRLIGENIRKRRTRLRISRVALAHTLDVPIELLGRYENGSARVTPVHLIAISDILQTTLSFLFTSSRRRSGKSVASRTWPGVDGALMRRGLAFAASVAMASPGVGAAAEITIACGKSIAYLPLLVMEENKLIEQQASKAGIDDLKVNYVGFFSATLSNDALIAGRVQFVAGTAPPFLTIWDRTGGKVKALSALGSLPLYLATRNPRVHNVADFGDSDRIAVTVPKATIQAITLQMAVAKALGMASYAQLDRLTVAMPPPEAAAALISGASITADMDSPPLSYRELETPGIHLVTSSEDVLGASPTYGLLYTTEEFYGANHRIVDVVMAALAEAMDLIHGDRAQAGRIYARVGDKSMAGSIERMVDDPAITFDQNSSKLSRYADFMHAVGTLRSAPANTRDLFFPAEGERFARD